MRVSVGAAVRRGPHCQGREDQRPGGAEGQRWDEGQGGNGQGKGLWGNSAAYSDTNHSAVTAKADQLGDLQKENVVGEHAGLGWQQGKRRESRIAGSGSSSSGEQSEEAQELRLGQIQVAPWQLV